MSVRTMIDCCTKDCPDRCADPNCHGYCKRYLEQRAELNEANTARQEKSQLESGITGTLVQGIYKLRHRQRRNKK